MDISGQNLGKYKIIKKIGGGGMGSVFLAEDTILEREVAIKLLLPILAADASFVERFQLEARALARLNHPAIVRVFDADWIEKQLYLAMEYVRGESLEDLLRKETPLPPDKIIEILSQVAEGLDYAHGFGLIHRDIKPGNILLGEKGQVQITDFGLVKDAETSLTADGQVLGTPAYMAPEQIQGMSVSPQLDVYALGIVAYEMFTGHPPFRGTISAVFEGHLLKEPPPFARLNPSVPEKIQEVVLNALSKSPTDRYPQATEFIKALLDANTHSQNLDAPFLGDVSTPSPQQDSRSKSALKNQTRRFPIGATSISVFIAGIFLCICSVAGIYIYSDQLLGVIPSPTALPIVLYQNSLAAQVGDDFPTTQQAEGIMEYSQGGYRIRVNAIEQTFWALAEGGYGNVTVEVDATQLGGAGDNEFGIICRYENPNNFYYGFVTSNGNYGIGHRVAGAFNILSEAPSNATSAINQKNTRNLIRLDCDGTDISLYANGFLLTSLAGIVETSSGDVGLIVASTLQADTDILFNDFLVTETKK